MHDPRNKEANLHFIFSPIGSAGDVHPMLSVALELQRRGHEITFVVNGYFRELIDRHGLRHVPLGSREEFLAGANHPDLWNPMRAFPHIYRSIVEPHLRTQYLAFAERYLPGQTVGIVNCFGFGGLLAQEKTGLPVVTIHLSPAVLWSDIEPPVLTGAAGPLWLRRLGFRLGERLAIDRTVCPSLNRLRGELGLQPIRAVVRGWHSPRGVICLFPEWFAPRQPDWPANVVFADFPLWDEQADEPLPPEVDDFLAGGPPPLVFTPGSANMFATAFFAAAAEACRRLGRRGILLTRFADQVPQSLPDGVVHYPYVPFRPLLSRSAAVIHHAGIGSTAQGLAAGIPQLVMPLAHDEFDNAARIRRLGVGSEIRPSRFHGPAVARELDALLTSPAVAKSCRQIAERCALVRGRLLAADALENVASASRPRGSESRK